MPLSLHVIMEAISVSETFTQLMTTSDNFPSVNFSISFKTDIGSCAFPINR